MHSYLHRFDTTIAHYVGLLPSWIHPFMTGVSFMGIPVVIIILGIVGSAISWLKGFPATAYAFLATLVALGGNTVIKHVVRRTRPDTIYVADMKIQSYSFPSGHAFGSTVLYGLLAYLAVAYLPQPFSWIVASVLVVLIFLIGLSRVYLGAHFPSDVVVGWLLGTVCLCLIIILLRP